MSDEIRQAAIDALDECDFDWAMTGLLADAVIAAVTPLIRRQALDEAESVINSFKLDRSGGAVDAPRVAAVGYGLNKAREIIRDLAAPVDDRVNG